MSVTVKIPSPLQKLTNNESEVTAKGTTIQELINDLERNFPGVKERLCDGEGKIRRFINIYINDRDIRFLGKDETSLKEGDSVSIIPAIAGG